MYPVPKVYKYLTFGELMGRPCPEEEIIKYIKDKNSRNILVALAALAALDIEDYAHIRPEFKTFLNKYVSRHYSINAVDECILASQQTIMATMKWVIVYGDFSIEKNIDDKSHIINESILLCSMIAGILGKKINYELGYDEFIEELTPEMIRNTHVNNVNQENANLDTVRLLCWINEIMDDNDLKKEPDYIDFRPVFYTYYGYTLDNYIATIFSIRASCATKFNFYKNIYNDYISHLTEFNADIMKKIIEHHSIRIEKAKEKLKNIYKNDWSLDFFWTYSFLKINDTLMLPLLPSILERNIFLTTRFEIQKIFPSTSSERKKFLSFYGKIQEKYIVKLLKESTASNCSVSIIPEFFYEKNSKKSSDAMVDIGGKILLIFESKGKFLKKDTLFSSDDEKCLFDEEDLAVKPLHQIIDRLADLINYREGPIDIAKYKKIYIFSLTTSGTFLNPFRQSKIKAMVDEYIEEHGLKNKIKGYFSIDIKSFEELIALLFISKQGKRRGISSILNELFLEKESINDFLYRKGYHFPIIPFLQKRKETIDEAVDSILKINHK